MKELAISLFVCFMVWQSVAIINVIDAKDKFNNCYNEAVETYSTQWNDICKQNKKGDNCWLNAFQYSGIEQQKDKKINLCVELYKVARK